jgi:hypothetical protein
MIDKHLLKEKAVVKAAGGLPKKKLHFTVSLWNLLYNT